MASVADRGLQPSKWTSARLHSEVIYAESQSQRFELSLKTASSDNSNSGGSPGGGQAAAVATEGGDNGSDMQPPKKVDLFVWVRCHRICPLSEIRRMGVPLPEGEMEVLKDDIEWEQVQWAPNGVNICGEFYPLARVHFMPRQAAQT